MVRSVDDISREGEFVNLDKSKIAVGLAMSGNHGGEAADQRNGPE